MNLLKTQAVLARIYTDEAFRRRWLCNPQAAGEEMGLLPDDARHISQISSEQVRCFADSLVRKRLREVHKLLPNTKGVFGPWFDRLFEQYASAHGLKMPRPHQQDACGFAAYLGQAIRSEKREPRWGAELARYETAVLKASDPQRRLIVRLLRCPIVLPEERAGRLLDLDMVRPRPVGRATLAVWFRPWRTKALRHLVVSVSFRSLPRLAWVNPGAPPRWRPG